MGRLKGCSLDQISAMLGQLCKSVWLSLRGITEKQQTGLWHGFDSFCMHGKFKVNVTSHRFEVFVDFGHKIILKFVSFTFYHWLQGGLTLLQSLHRLSDNCLGIAWLYRLSFITLLSHFGSFGLWLRSFTVRGQSAFIFSDYAIRDCSMSI